MLRLRNQSTNVLFGAAFIVVSMLASPSFADMGGGNADQIPLVTNHFLVGSPQVRFPAATPSVVDKSNVCHGGYRWIQRDPDPNNGDRQAFSLPVRCSL